MFDSALVQRILNALLDRLEQPGRRRVVRVRLNEREHAEYFSATNVTPRLETNAALQELAPPGIVQLHWRKWEEGNWLEAVDLAPARAEELYARLGRIPRVAQEQALREMLAAQTPRGGWHTGFLKWALGQLDAQRPVAPLDLGDPKWNAALLHALDALAQLQTPLLERTFSVRLFANSKQFEELRGAVLSVLRRFDPEAGAYGDDDRALLRAHGLERIPEYVPLAGALVLRVENAKLELAPFVPSVALSAATLRVTRVQSCAARAVVTVENATSFSELLPYVRPIGFFAVYTGGFASPSVIAFLQTLRAAHPELPFFHWGDLDVGGLRILAHLRKQLGEIRALGMNAETFDLFHAHAQPLSADERAALAELYTRPELIDCKLLIERLLETGSKLEQEAIAIGKIVQALAPSEASWD